MVSAPIFDLSGRVAIVTGASSGIGARWGRILAQAGAKVVLAARRIDRLKDNRDSIIAAGGAAIAVEMDVADENSTIAAYDAANDAFGEVDTIIANAGVSGEGNLLDLPVGIFDETVAINLRGVYLTAREGARRLVRAGSKERMHGRIVITSSITAHSVEANLPAYSATKAGVQQMGKVMARDWIRQGINVNMICPGYIKTEINGEWFDSEAGARQIARFHRRRLLEESDLDPILLYLASDASRAVTGAAFTIDDGQSL